MSANPTPRCLNPRQLNREEYTAYRLQWQALMRNADLDRLRSCLRAYTDDKTTQLLNYVYLTPEVVSLLLHSVGDNNVIQAVLVVVQEDTDCSQQDSIFSLVLTWLDTDNTPQYYLAGVMGRAELKAGALRPRYKTTPASDKGYISPTDAAKWIIAWNEQTTESVKFSLFTPDTGDWPQPAIAPSAAKPWPLLARTFPASDFRHPAKSKSDAEGLWLAFDLTNWPQPDGELLFGLVVISNPVPTATNIPPIYLSNVHSFHDLSKPCPPACSMHEYDWLNQQTPAASLPKRPA